MKRLNFKLVILASVLGFNSAQTAEIGVDQLFQVRGKQIYKLHKIGDMEYHTWVSVDTKKSTKKRPETRGPALSKMQLGDSICVDKVYKLDRTILNSFKLNSRCGFIFETTDIRDGSTNQWVFELKNPMNNNLRTKAFIQNSISDFESAGSAAKDVGKSAGDIKDDTVDSIKGIGVGTVKTAGYALKGIAGLLFALGNNIKGLALRSAPIDSAQSYGECTFAYKMLQTRISYPSQQCETRGEVQFGTLEVERQ